MQAIRPTVRRALYDEQSQSLAVSALPGNGSVEACRAANTRGL